jgi:BASS family bile acid:Na+ symporter
VIARITQLFPVWALLCSLLAWQQPQLFIEFKAAIVPLLGIVMFGMGLSLRLTDFRRVFTQPRLVALGVTLQFCIMPAFAWLIAHLFDLDPLLSIGMILVGSCPGGTASNVICYLARGNVALSITLTAVSTLLAVILTPWLTWWLAASTIDVPALGMFLSILKIVILPVVAGLFFNHFFHSRLTPMQPLFALVSVCAIVFIIAIIVALNADQLAGLSLLLFIAVAAHNVAGLLSGYWLTRLLGYDEREARTLGIEVGMQNSGLAVALALKFFSPAAALPGAVFSIWHNLSGSGLVYIWTRNQPDVQPDPGQK